jgi:hypothetical protein
MNKINKRRIRASFFNPIITASMILMIIFSFIIGIMVVSRMAITSKEVIKSEAEAGNELIRIYISIDEEYENSSIITTYTKILNTTTSIITTNTSIINKKYETRVTITNQWGKTSVIDYFLIEDWNHRIISKGDLNIVLEAGEEMILKGDDLINTFKLNDSAYIDFWHFKRNVRCITLHTILGNTFGSAYYPIKGITQTAQYYELTFYRTTEKLIQNQTFTTTYFGEYTLIIESQISYYDCVDPINNVWRWRGPYNDVDTHYVCSSTYGWTKYVMNDIINPNSDPYGRKYLDGSYNYPAGILLTISHSLPWSCSGNGKVDRGYSNILHFEGGLGINMVRMELWELDQFGNEIRKILETTSNSITFAIFGNYKLKRFFEGRDKGQVMTKTTTTQIYTSTNTITSYTREEKIGYVYWKAVRKDEENQQNILIKLADSGWWIEMVSYKYDTHGNGNAWWGEKDPGPNQYAVWIYAYCHFTNDDPNAYIEFWMYYKEYRYIPA